MTGPATGRKIEIQRGMLGEKPPVLEVKDLLKKLFVFSSLDPFSQCLPRCFFAFGSSTSNLAIRKCLLQAKPTIMMVMMMRNCWSRHKTQGSYSKAQKLLSSSFSLSPVLGTKESIFETRKEKKIDEKYQFSGGFNINILLEEWPACLALADGHSSFPLQGKKTSRGSRRFDSLFCATKFGCCKT